MEKKLVRSRSDRMIAGVAGGLGEYLRVDPVWIRLLFVVLLFASGFGFWAYLILWIIMPEEGREVGTTSETLQANVQEVADRARDFGANIQRSIQGSRATTAGRDNSGPVIVGLAFIVLGVIMLLSRLGIFWWWNWGIMWPLLLVLIGGALLYSRLRE